MDLNTIAPVVEYCIPYVVPVLLIMFSISLWSFYINSTRDTSSNLPLPPGTVGVPFVGETIHMILKGFDFYRHRREKYGRVYKTHILGKPTVRVWGVENIKKVLQNEETFVTMSWPNSVKQLMGLGGLVTSTRKLHNMRRSAVLKAFTTSAIHRYAKGMERIIAEHMKNWCEKGQVLAAEESKKLAFATTARMLLGCDFSDKQMTSMMTSMTVMVDNFFTLPINVPGFGFYKAMRARKQLLATLDDIITKQHNSTEVDAVSILLQEVKDGNLTMTELKDSIIEMLFSAFHGMTSLCCSTFLELARHPEVTDKVADELQKSGLMNGELDPKKLSQLPYLQMVCKELLRFAPPYGGGFRQVLKTFELEGYQIPKGWTVLYSIRDNHEVDENFTNARTFNPERWETQKSNDAYIPFGGNGIRSCVGEQYMTTFVQIFVCQVTRGCQWDLADQNTRSTYFPVQMPTNGLPINFTESLRKSKA